MRVALPSVDDLDTGKNFPLDVLEEAKMLHVGDNAFTKRTEVQGISIVSPRMRSIGSAFDIKETPDGWRIEFHITDASLLVQAESKTDTEAMRRICSRTREATMQLLPSEFSENKISLKPGQDRPTITVVVQLSNKLTIEHTEIWETFTRNRRIIDFKQVPSLLDSKDPDNELLAQCHLLADRLNLRRAMRGALSLYDLKTGRFCTEEGEVAQISPSQAIGHRISNELSILINEAVSDFAQQHNISLIFRNHMPASDVISRAPLFRQLKEVIDAPNSEIQKLQSYIRRQVGFATYGANPSGHFGQFLSSYTHITTPLHRYVDLVNQRMLKSAIGRGNKQKYTNEELENLERYISMKTLKLEDRNVALGSSIRPISIEVPKGGSVPDYASLSHSEMNKLIAGMMTNPLKLLHPDLYQEIVNRLREGELDPVSIYNILFEVRSNGRHFKEMREVVFETLMHYPHHATAVVNLASQCGSHWKRIRNEVTPYEGDFIARVVVNVDGKKYLSPDGFVQSDNMKQASHMANAYFLRSFFTTQSGSLQLASGITPSSERIRHRAVKEEKVQPSSSVVDPVVALEHFCSVHKAGDALRLDVLPASGKAFMCVANVEIGEEIYTSRAFQGRNENEIRRQAAQNLLEILQRDHRLQHSKKQSPKPAISVAAKEEDWVGKLNSLKQKYGWAKPKWKIEPKIDGGFICVGTIQIDGTAFCSDSTNGMTEMQAKCHAAENLLQKIPEYVKQRKKPVLPSLSEAVIELTRLCQKSGCTNPRFLQEDEGWTCEVRTSGGRRIVTQSKSKSDAARAMMQFELQNEMALLKEDWISKVIQWCTKNTPQAPTFQLKQSKKMGEVECVCTVQLRDGISRETSGHSTNEKMAKRKAAKDMYDYLVSSQ